MQFIFGSPYFLLLLLLLPCLLWCIPYNKIYYFPKIEWLRKQSPFPSIETWLKISIYTLMVVALAKPFVYDASERQYKKGRDLILAIDASGSMSQSGFDEKDRFKSKYEATINLSKLFIQNRFDDNMGIVIFGTFAYTASPLTYDLEALSHLLAMTTVGVAGESTAIGDALMQSIRTLSFGEAKNRVIILLTDGYHNAGRTSPKSAVAKAKALGIKIYTIGIGEESSYDSRLLEVIAKESGAKSYAAHLSKSLSEVYKEIDALEPSSIRGENYLNKHLLTLFPLGLAFILLLVLIAYQREDRI